MRVWMGWCSVRRGELAQRTAMALVTPLRVGHEDMAKKLSAKKVARVSEPIFTRYKPLVATYDEYFAEAGKVRPQASTVVQHLEGLGRDEIRGRMRVAHASFLEGGITFSVYSDARGGDKP